MSNPTEPFSWTNVLIDTSLVGVGGALGAALRYLVGVGSLRLVGDVLPATLVVNVLGSAALGYLTAAYLSGALSPRLALLLGVGLLGGFTTFSSYALEVVRTGAEARLSLSLGLILGHNMLAVGGAYVGWRLGTS